MIKHGTTTSDSGLDFNIGKEQKQAFKMQDDANDLSKVVYTFVFKCNTFWEVKT